MDFTLAELQSALWLQASLTVFLALLFALLYRRLGREPFFGWWTLAWAVFAVYLIAAASSLALDRGLLRSSAVLISIVVGLGSPVLIVAGIRAFERPDLSQRRVVAAALVLTTLLAIGTYAVSVSADVTPMFRALIRSFPRLVLSGLALGFAAVTLLRSARASSGAALLAGICCLWSLEQFAFALSGARRIALELELAALAWLPDLSGVLTAHWAVVDVLWQGGIALALVLLLLERHERAGARLRAATTAHQALVEASPLAIISLDDRAVVRTWNPAAERLLGWSAAEVLEQRFPAPRPEDAEANRQFRARVLTGETVLGREAVYRRKDGSDVPVLESAAPLRDAHGRVIGLTRLLADLTELRSTEAQLRQAQKMEAVGRLAGGVAHDFNNLLTAVLTTAEIAADDLPPEHPVRADLATIIEAGTRAAALTRQLLAFSRQQLLQPELLDPNLLVAHLHGMLTRVIGADVSLRLELGTLESGIRADRNQLEQALTNLVVNARDALPSGGRITLATREVELDATRQGAAGAIPAGAYVAVEVRDTGIGMEPAVLRRAFEPFFTTKEPGRGTGLGLAMVYGFVQQSDGWMDVTTAPGAGTTMTIYLPRHPLPADVVEETRAPEPPVPAEIVAAAAPAATVLVAEDDRLVRELTRALLAARGYRVLVAENGRAALEVAQSHGQPLDLLLTDVVMPEMGGFELERRMRERQPDLRVIFMSGYVDESVVGRDGLPEGAELVQKPFTANALAARIQAALADRA